MVDPEVCPGQMTFRGTRVPVDTVVTFLAKGYSVDQMLRSWPELTQPAVEEAIRLAQVSSNVLRFAPGGCGSFVRSDARAHRQGRKDRT